MKKSTRRLIYFIFSLLVVLQIVGVITFATGVLTFGLNVITFSFFCLMAAFVAFCVMLTILLIKNRKKRLERLRENQAARANQQSLLSMYETLGIPPQYHKDGTLKTYYDLLGIKPVFDENGERVLTIYEILGFPPRFDSEGKEIPGVVFIKNTAKKFSKYAPGSSTQLMTKTNLPVAEKSLSGVGEKKSEAKAPAAGKKDDKKKDDKKKEAKGGGGGGKKEKPRVADAYVFTKSEKTDAKINESWKDFFGMFKIEKKTVEKSSQPVVISKPSITEVKKETPKPEIETSRPIQPKVAVEQKTDQVNKNVSIIYSTVRYGGLENKPEKPNEEGEREG